MSSLAITSPEKPVLDLFFECHRPELMAELTAFLTRDTAGIVASYVLGKENLFGPAQWKRYFGVDIAHPPKLPVSFYTWWFGPDHVDSTKQCCETHLPPVLRPTGMSIKKLGELVKAPLEGNPSRYHTATTSIQHNESLEAGPACWLSGYMGIFGRNHSYEHMKQFIRNLNHMGAAYEEEPSAIDLATVVFARNVATDEFLSLRGDDQNSSYSIAKETVYSSVGDQYHLVVGNFDHYRGLEISHIVLERLQGGRPSGKCGIAGLRKF